jgi:hypothetical protein
MNRYSLIFALLIASTFAVGPARQANEPPSDNQTPTKTNERNGNKPKSQQPHSTGESQSLSDKSALFLQSFTAKTQDKGQHLQVLFATVPHPTETNLSAAFDHNIEALQDGLQDAHYVFDSSWIPWQTHDPRETFDDDQKEKKAKTEEDACPGILLFRKEGRDPYSNGLIVFLLSEKPTQGIGVSQLQAAETLLTNTQLPALKRIRILGPSFTGSFASLTSIVQNLHDNYQPSNIDIYSGSVSGGAIAQDWLTGIRFKFSGTTINFGSAQHDYTDWKKLATDTLENMGIGADDTLYLSEDETAFGAILDRSHDLFGWWTIKFPRDISSLRAGYAQQGLFDEPSPALPWKRVLNFNSETHSDEDTVRQFGGTSTVEAQEAVLLGISNFIKAHGIRAVVISATNEEDRLFLTRFIHSNNGGVRVVVIGASRIFMRGATAQFRGDLIIDDFPMLPRLVDWTGGAPVRGAHVFSDGGSQGIYFAAIELVETDPKQHPFAEYSEPNWFKASCEWPPMYAVALGSNSTWPVDAELYEQDKTKCDTTTPNMPVAHDITTDTSLSQIHVGRHWKILGALVTFLIFLYCAAIWYANPIARDLFASFQPTPGWEYWMLKVTIPAFVAGAAFWVLARAVAIPRQASSDAALWWWITLAGIFLAPLAVLGSAVVKAWKYLPHVKITQNKWVLLSIGLTVLLSIVLVISGYMDMHSHPFTVGAILNTYREMHWESGLSLLPTWLFFLTALLVWASQAGNGAAALQGASPLPVFRYNMRISNHRAQCIVQDGRPLPNCYLARWFWFIWGIPAVVLFVAHFVFPPFKEITTLDSQVTSTLTRAAAGILSSLILLDLLQFLWLWKQLQGLLRALCRTPFKRSFVTITEFDWRGLWSFSGISFEGRRAINTALIDCLSEIAETDQFQLKTVAKELDDTRRYYNTHDLTEVESKRYQDDVKMLFDNLSSTGNTLAAYIEDPNNKPTSVTLSPVIEALQRALQCQCKDDRWGDEKEELARLPELNQLIERFLCLMYIGFIQSVLARLHTLLASVAFMYSLVALGVAIYPFVPSTPMLMTGGALLILIGWAFFKVFSEMNKDPILSRIVAGGPDRKFQDSPYVKFAESMALPILAALSSLLPGGTARLLELVQAVIPHGS